MTEHDLTALGWAPRISWNDGMQQLVADVQKQEEHA
jgi:nucleoside-diphosphate-sugar epimerase